METLPLHYAGVPQKLKKQVLSHSLSRVASSTQITSPIAFLGPYHFQRFEHSCRILGFKTSRSLWQELEILRSKLSVSADYQIYSLRYFGSSNAREKWQENYKANIQENKNHPTESKIVSESKMVYWGEDWVLLERPNPYSFASSTLPFTWFPSWASLPRVAIESSFGSLFESEAEITVRMAKCYWHVERAKQLLILQQQPIYADCAEILHFTSDTPPLLLEGMKSNVFLLKYNGDKLYLYTPRFQIKTPFLCGTTRNWLCQNAAKLPLLRVIEQDITLNDLLQADGLLICNAAMGLRLIRELWLPNNNLDKNPATLHCYHTPAMLSLFQLFAMYWHAQF